MDLPDAAVGARDRLLRGRQCLAHDVLHRAEARLVEEHGDAFPRCSRSPGRLAVAVQVADRDRWVPKLRFDSRPWPGSVPSPLLSSTVTVSASVFAVARSGLPSPFRSPTATESGCVPGAVVALGREGAVAAVEEHAHGVRRTDVRGREVGLAVAVQVADRDRVGVASRCGSRALAGRCRRRC